MMLGEIAAGLSSLKAAADIVKGLNAASTQAAINEVKIGLQGHIIEAREALSAAQETQTASLQRIRELEQEIVQLKNWESDKQRYQLGAIGGGATAYMLKPGMENGEPPHWLCANCYSAGKKSFLQPKGRFQRDYVFKCSACDCTMLAHGTPS